MVFADVVSGVELVDCDACKLQCTGTVNTVSIDKSQGIQVYPLPSTLYPLPSTLYPLSSTLYPLHATRYTL